MRLNNYFNLISHYEIYENSSLNVQVQILTIFEKTKSYSSYFATCFVDGQNFNKLLCAYKIHN